MKFKAFLIAGAAIGALNSGAAFAAPAADGTGAAPAAAIADASPAAGSDEVIVTARRREESLKNVPIAVTALAGSALKDQQVNTVKDIANYVPGLSINSDSVSRSFITIRGIGTTLIDTVQPGVGIFIDGIYQPNTSYLNSPIVDVARIEVLRGPQGTLFGNNTLGGAINIITRQPGNEWEGRVDAAYAGPDDYKSLSGSISGPIAKDVLQFRLGAAYHAQDGFGKNTLAGGLLSPLRQKSVNGTLRLLASPDATITANASYDHVYGATTQYIHVTGPTDYTQDGATNVANRAGITYYAANVKGEFNLDPINTKLTGVLAYNRKNLNGVSDGDFGPVDLLRSDGGSHLTTKTAELRFDTQWTDAISTLVGLYADGYVQNATNAQTLNYAALGLPLPASTSLSTAHTKNDNRAVFGTIFAKLSPTLDLAVGGRYDHQHLVSSQVNSGAPFAPPVYTKNAFEPRVTLTEHWTPDVMTYASVSKGIRGGGQNGPGTRPQDATYKGDSVWTYELGTKFNTPGNRLTINADIYYNDYKDFVGQNSLAPNASGAGFVAINLNTGHVNSYGAEVEAHLRVTDQWRIDGGLSLLHARITNDDEYFATTGTHVSTNHIIFTPDYNFNASTSYTVPVGANALVFNAGITGKGSRYGSSLDQNVAPKLSSYTLTNASIAFRLANGFEIAAFGTNLFNSKYIESYIDRSLLVRAGLAPLASDLAIQGDRRRYGVRASFKF